MLKALLARIHQGRRTLAYPRVVPALPARFRGLPQLEPERCAAGCRDCIEACPTDAITHGHGFELASYNATGLVYRKDQLLAITPSHEGDNARFNVMDEKKMRMIAR